MNRDVAMDDSRETGEQRGAATVNSVSHVDELRYEQTVIRRIFEDAAGLRSPERFLLLGATDQLLHRSGVRLPLGFILPWLGNVGVERIFDVVVGEVETGG